MNKQIRKLADQAGVNLSSFQFSGTPSKYEVSEHELEKFAELIVRECSSMIESQDVDPAFKFRMSSAFKKSFGITE